MPLREFLDDTHQALGDSYSLESSNDLPSLATRLALESSSNYVENIILVVCISWEAL